MTNLFFISSAFSQSQGGNTNDSLQIEALSSSASLDSALLTKKIRTNFSIGFRGGISIGKLEIASPLENDQNTTGIGSSITVFTNYRINSKFSIQPEINVGKYRSNNTLYQIALTEGKVDYSISTYDFNLLGVYSYSIKDWFSLSLEAGGSVAYLQNSFGKVVAPNIHVGGFYDTNSDNQFEKLNYGAIIGIVPSFNFENISIQASIRYRYGLNNINTFDYKLNRYLSDSERTIQTRDIIFQIGFFVPIYKKEKVIGE
ncbi:porin family protein [Bernardetia sp. Wsw4-3y2]|uniref:porin family protein n=1 Tax=Bernardetia sp. Wsw4-3y2 TaxID=3127471 RepID=UPI0030CAE64C